MMGHGVVRVDLPEARELLSDFLVRENANAEPRLALYILVERNLGARQQTDRNMRLPDRREAAGDGIVELGRHELVLDLGRPVRARAASSIPAAPGHCRAVEDEAAHASRRC
jgi:hypothetical protein